jgi:protoporphyrinogen oxidase
MERIINKFKGKIIHNSYPTKIKLGEQSLTLYYKEDGSNKKSKFDYLVSSIPIDELVNLFGSSIPAEVRDYANELRFRAMRQVFILLDRDQVFKSQWVYFHDDEYIFTRVNEFKNMFEGFSPYNKTSLICEITCFEGDEIWQMEDEVLFEKTLEPLIKRGFFEREEVSDWFVKNLSHAYPIFKIDSIKKVDTILEYFDSLDFIYTIGRQGRFQYINMDECMHQGFTTAQQINSKMLKEL